MQIMPEYTLAKQRLDELAQRMDKPAVADVWNHHKNIYYFQIL